MGAAAIDDATAWCLLTLAISIANAGDLSEAGYVFATVVAFALFLIFAVRPVFGVLVEYVEAKQSEWWNSNLFCLTVMMLFMCAWTTSLLGVHAIFGAFLFGLTIPRGSHLYSACIERIESFVLTITLPLYFTLSGLKTDVTTIRTPTEGGITVLVVVCAVFGKFCGAGGAALFSRMTLRESSVIAVLMNTRGLVELIVLNLGISSGILNTRTFSVMVIMCLVTTFMTSPIIELIYPPSMRMRAADEEKLREHGSSLSGAQGELEMMPLVDHSGKHSRIAVVVDSMPQLQDIMNVMTFFVPYTSDSELVVTAMRFVEPTLSNRDELVPPDENGRLILVEQESTEIASAMRDLDHGASKSPGLLALTAFCRALHAGINAFSVRGDPDSFPSTLCGLTESNDCSMIMFPWRPASLYAQKFLWSTIHAANVPVAIIWSNESREMFESQARQGGRSRSGTVSSSDNAHHGRGRGNSLFMMGGSDAQHDGALYNTVPSDGAEQRKPNTATNKVTGTTRATSKILLVVTGSPLDANIFALARRFALHAVHDVHVLVPKDHASFPADQVDALSAFTKHVAKEKAGNLKIQYVAAASADVAGIYQAIKNLQPFDLCISAFIEPTAANTNIVSAEGRLRNVGMTSGVPVKYAAVEVEYPELGALGHAIHAENCDSPWKMVILHMARAGRKMARGSIHSDITVATEELQAASAAAQMYSADEAV